MFVAFYFTTNCYANNCLHMGKKDDSQSEEKDDRQSGILE